MPNLQRLKPRVPKVLFFDIETSPIIGTTWKKWDTNVVDIVEDWKMLCFAYRWGHQQTVKVVAQCDMDGYDPTRRPWTHSDDLAVCQALWALFDEADIVVGHNGDQFDVKKANARFLEHRLGPPSPFKTVDTLKVARRGFKLTTNRLDDIGQQLGLGEKAPSSYDLWRGCMAGEAKAWRLMKSYNRQDVHLLIAVYLELLPWMDRHPHMGLLSGELDGCRNCGSLNLTPDGFDYTATRVRQRVRCDDCGAWGKSTTSLPKIAAAYT